MKAPKSQIDYKRTFYQILGFAVFILLVYVLYNQSEEHIEMKNDYASKRLTAVIYDKTAAKGLYSSEPYYVALLEPNLVYNSIYNLSDGQSASITKEQFETLSSGDRIEGYNIDGTFFVEADIKSEFKWFWIIFALLGIYPAGYIIYMLSKIKPLARVIGRFLDRHDRIFTYLINTVLFGGVVIGILYVFSLSADSIKNISNRTTSIDMIETTAKVTDKSKSYGKDRRYYIALFYKDEYGEPIHVTKEITLYTYQTFESEMPIMYKKDNPYHLYMDKIHFWDVISLMISKTVMLYFVTLIGAALLIYTVYLLDRKRRTGDYW